MYFHVNIQKKKKNFVLFAPITMKWVIDAACDLWVYLYTTSIPKYTTCGSCFLGHAWYNSSLLSIKDLKKKKKII